MFRISIDTSTSCLIEDMTILLHLVSLAERSKAPDSSSGGAIRVGSNPTADSIILSLLC